MLKIKNKTILLFGYYGKSNIGDDIMLINLVGLLEKKQASKIIVLVDKNFNIEKHFSEKVVFIKGIKNNLFSFLSNFLRTYSFIFFFLTCFFDNPSLRGLNELLYFTRLRKFFGREKRKNFFIGIGVEKVEKNKKIIQSILKNTDGLILRDSLSLQNLQNITVDLNKEFDFIKVYGDMVFFKSIFDLLPEKTQLTNEQYITFSGHFKYETDDSMIEHTAKQLKDISVKENINHFKFLPAKYSKSGDNIFHKKVATKMTKESNLKVEVVAIQDTEHFISLLNRGQKHIGMRLHSLVLADILNIPNLAVAYQEKIKQYNTQAIDPREDWYLYDFKIPNKKQINSFILKNNEDYESFFE